jgi:hypothetical protein
MFTPEIQKMNTLLIRVGLLLLHVFLNVVIAAYLTRFDISGSWLSMIAFAICGFILLALLILHIMSFIKFYKHK